MLTTDAEFDIRPRLATTLGRQAYQFTNAVRIETDKRILFDDATVLVVVQERARIVAAETVGGLREVVRTKLKNAAGPAMASACRAARGNSIIVPTRYSSSTPASAVTSP